MTPEGKGTRASLSWILFTDRDFRLKVVKGLIMRFWLGLYKESWVAFQSPTRQEDISQLVFLLRNATDSRQSRHINSQG